MPDRAFIVASAKDTAANCLCKVLRHLTEWEIESRLVLNYRTAALVDPLTDLADKSGHRIVLGSSIDGIWETLLGIVLSDSATAESNPVFIVANRFVNSIADDSRLRQSILPLNVRSLLDWFVSLKPSLSVPIPKDVEAAKTFLRVNWHDLKFDLKKSHDRFEESGHVRMYFDFLDWYADAPQIKFLLGDKGARLYELGTKNRLALSRRDDVSWRTTYDALVSCFNAMNDISPRR